MLPYLNAFNGLLEVFSLVPLPFKEFVTTFFVLSIAFALLKFITSRT